MMIVEVGAKLALILSHNPGPVLDKEAFCNAILFNVRGLLALTDPIKGPVDVTIPPS